MKAATWMLDADGELMPPALDLYHELRLTEDQWAAWWDVWDTEANARTRGRGGVRISLLTGDPEQPRWVEVVDALIELDRIDKADRATALKSEWIKFAGCPGCGSSGAFLRRDAKGRYAAGQVRLSCGRRCRTRDVLRQLGVDVPPDVYELVGRDERRSGTQHRASANGPQEAAQAPQESDPGAEPAVHEHEARRLILTPASAIKPRRVLWAWAGRLALGTLALLAGREGLGKSTLAYWIAARLSRGELPGEYRGTPKSVLVCATEDSWEHTIVPRLIAAGADLDRVFRVEVRSADEIVLGLSLPRDLHRVEQAAAETDAALLLLDPLMSRLADDLDTHRDGDVRRALEPLVAVADRTAMTVLGLIHHNKSGSADPLQLVMGSKAFTAVARSVHTVVPDPDDDTEQRRLFGTPKNNLGRTDLPMLAFTVTGHPVETDDGTAWTSRLEWGEEIADTIGETMRRAQDAVSDRGATQEAADWLADYIQMHGGSAASADVKRDGAKAGHSVDALKRARRKLRLTTRSEGFPRVTHWEFPVGAQLEQQLEQPSRGDALTAPTAPTEPSQRSQRSWSSGRRPGEPAAPTGDEAPTSRGELGPDDGGTAVEPGPKCQLCGQPLLLATPGRTVCERCRLDHRQPEQHREAS
ncbi:AAA family ATPase [Quadrisphaera sp. GCM10027208]|uniref:AAA family ATPase n=1 Tax=Quadrisphaera sp. GCM10027208 TaxID=3273423 RepID=UPI003609F4D3